MKKVLVLCLIMLTCGSTYAKKKKANPYHTPGTKEYKEVTAKLLGKWKIISFSKKNDDKMGEVYDEASFEITDLSGGLAVFKFKLKRDIVDQRLHAWNRKGTTLTVDDYYLVCTVKFGIHKKGDLIYLDNQSNSAVITGSGEQLENFQGVETAYIQTQANMKASGGLTGMLGAAVLKEVSGTDFQPRVPTQVNYKKLKDTSVEFVSLFKHSIKMVKE